MIQPVLKIVRGLIKLAEATDQSSGFSPDPSSYIAGEARLQSDFDGNLKTRGRMLTEEGSFRDDFVGSSLLTTLTGTSTFTASSDQLLGTGTLYTTEVKTGDYIKKTADAEGLLVRVSSVEDDTHLTFEENYAGITSTTTAQKSAWLTNTPATASITVASSLLSIVAATGNGTNTGVMREGDYCPYQIITNFTISQRIANQVTTLGLVDVFGAPTIGAAFVFSGTVNTTVTCFSIASSAAADQQTSSVSIPAGGISSGTHKYEINVSNNQVSFMIDDIVVATHTTHIPGPYDLLNLTIKVANSAAVTATTVTADYFLFYNMNQVEVTNSFLGEPIKVQGTTPQGTTQSGNAVKIGGVYTSTLPTVGTNGLINIQLDTRGRIITSPDRARTTYSANAIGFQIVNSGTDFFTLTGSASKTVTIKKVVFSAFKIAVGVSDIVALKRSTANTGGTSSTLTNVPHNSTNAAATAVARSYTANPTLGTLVGNLRSYQYFFSTNAVQTQTLVIDFGEGDQEIVLNGTSEVFSLNANAISLAGNDVNCSITWTEE